MSRVGKVPINIPDKVKVSFNNSKVCVEGPLGKLEQNINTGIEIEIKDNTIFVKRNSEGKREKAFHGLYQRLINNMVIGVTKGFQKDLEIHGVGYRAKAEGKSVTFQLGFSHPIKYTPPESIKMSVEGNTKININGIDKQLVGEVAATIRRYYPPEPYKGKGIRYVGEHVRRKAGKAAAAKGGAK